MGPSHRRPSSLPAPTRIELDQTLELEGETLDYHFVDSGSPHAVLFERTLPRQMRDDLQVSGINRLGALIRYHRTFAPGGTNVNFIHEAKDYVYQRTYERGVEDETLACGTGAIAVATVAMLKAGYVSPVKIRTRGGEDLIVSHKPADTRVDLAGGATFVFEGDMEID